MKITAIILTFIAAVFTAVTAFQVGTLVNGPAADAFAAGNLSSLYLGLTPLWLPTAALDVACFTIWRLFSKPVVWA